MYSATVSTSPLALFFIQFNWRRVCFRRKEIISKGTGNEVVEHTVRDIDSRVNLISRRSESTPDKTVNLPKTYSCSLAKRKYVAAEVWAFKPSLRNEPAWIWKQFGILVDWWSVHADWDAGRQGRDGPGARISIFERLIGWYPLHTESATRV